MGMSMNIDRSNAFVNDLLNTTRSNSYTPRVGMDITPSDKFSLFINTRWRMTNTSYNLNSKLNQKSKNFTHSVEMNADLFAGLKLNTNLDLTMFRNDRLNLSQDVPIWNVSIYKQFLKGNKAEVRLSVYDVLNKNIAINQWASNYFITESRTETLTQYAMLSFTYNLKGIGTKKRRMMF